MQNQTPRRANFFDMRAALLPVLLLAACSGGTADARQKAIKTPFVSTEMGRFNEPWAMTFLPDGRALVTEKSGKLLVWSSKDKPPVIVTGTPEVSNAGQGGFGDVVLHPNFKMSGLVYLSWSEASAEGKGSAVARARLVEAAGTARLEGLSIIWRQTPKVTGNGHFGHRIAFAPDGKLFISSGERQKFTPSQDMQANLGKVIRLNDDGSLPTDNPFAAQGGVAAQIWSLGHRNPLGLAFAPGGSLWNTEMGPYGGDELNLVKRAANYGYPNVSNGSHYDGRDIPDHKSGDGWEPPNVWWNPSISPGSLMIYSGALFPKWEGDAFIGGLGSQALIRVDLNGASASKADQWDMGQRIREVEQGPDGAIWVLEDSKNGRLLKLTPK